MTYNVFSGTLNLTQSIYILHRVVIGFEQADELVADILCTRGIKQNLYHCDRIV